jgi:hypothetical protein
MRNDITNLNLCLKQIIMTILSDFARNNNIRLFNYDTM